MRLLAAVERFFERLFERPSARLFRARLQPVHLQRRIERAMEEQRLSGADRTFVPNRFEVRLSPGDLEAFGEFAERLATELADGALRFARSHRYALVDRPRVELRSHREVLPGDVEVTAGFSDGAGRQVDPVAVGRDVGAPDGGVPGGTMVFEVPRTSGPQAILRAVRRDGTEREIALDGRPLTIGRASDNVLVLDDARVSRHHGRLHARRGTLLYTDLGSTNGTRVNGAAVREIVLGEGDRIEIGDTVLVVQSFVGE